MVVVEPITYSKHARDQMQRRGVTEDDVEWALKRQTGDRPGEPGTLWIEGWAVGGRILSVWLTLPSKRFVVTVAWLHRGEEAP
jgi:predicted alpha/beta-fold hydrolase